MTETLDTHWLGRISFTDALARQERLVADRQSNTIPDTLLFLEHEPVFTIGRTRDQTSLRDPASLPYPVETINRGGQATYHGPGQLVGYFILDLATRGKDLHRYLRWMEESLIAVLAGYRIEAIRCEDLTGVWVNDRKIASIGVGVKRWVSMHGFALNIHGTLDGFNHITPCGLANVTITSIERETTRTVTVKEVATTAARIFADRLPLLAR